MTLIRRSSSSVSAERVLLHASGRKVIAACFTRNLSRACTLESCQVHHWHPSLSSALYVGQCSEHGASVSMQTLAILARCLSCVQLHACKHADSRAGTHPTKDRDSQIIHRWTPQNGEGLSQLPLAYAIAYAVHFWCPSSPPPWGTGPPTATLLRLQHPDTASTYAPVGIGPCATTLSAQSGPSMRMRRCLQSLRAYRVCVPAAGESATCANRWHVAALVDRGGCLHAGRDPNRVVSPLGCLLQS